MLKLKNGFLGVHASDLIRGIALNPINKFIRIPLRSCVLYVCENWQLEMRNNIKSTIRELLKSMNYNGVKIVVGKCDQTLRGIGDGVNLFINFSHFIIS